MSIVTDTSITKFYAGSSEVLKIYAGSTLVYEPVSAVNWTDNNVGSFLTQSWNTNAFRADWDYNWDADPTYRYAGRMATSSGGSSPYHYSPESNYYTPANVILTPPYVAVWCPPEHTTDGSAYGRNDTSGWYLYERNGYIDGTPEGSTPSGNTRAKYQALAWPTGANNDDGYMGMGGGDTYKFFIAQFSSYSGPTGSGGTDSWTAPFDWSTPRYTMTATIAAQNGTKNEYSLSGISETGDTGDWQAYGYYPLRGNSTNLDIIYQISTSGSYTSGNDFFDKTELQHLRLQNTTVGSEWDTWENATYRSVKFGDSSSNEPWGAGITTYLRTLYFTGGGLTAFGNFSVGDTIQLDLFYTDK